MTRLITVRGIWIIIVLVFNIPYVSFHRPCSIHRLFITKVLLMANSLNQLFLNNTFCNITGIVWVILIYSFVWQSLLSATSIELDLDFILNEWYLLILALWGNNRLIRKCLYRFLIFPIPFIVILFFTGSTKHCRQWVIVVEEVMWILQITLTCGFYIRSTIIFRFYTLLPISF